MAATAPPQRCPFSKSQLDAVIELPQRRAFPKLFFHTLSVMVNVDDYRHGDTVLPLTIWQMMQMAPFVLILREYCIANLLLSPYVENYTLV